MPGKVKFHTLSENQKKKHLGEFYSMVSELKNREEAKNFFKDLLTLSEVVMISRRIQVAKMLLEGSNYEVIRKELRVGFSTIAHVEKWLNNGFGGYKKVIADYEKRHGKEKKAPPFRRGMMKKYPFHYLLWDLVNGR